MKRTAPFVAVMLLAACSGGTGEKIEAKDGEIVSNIIAGSPSEKELEESLKSIKEEEERRLAEEKANSTTLEFDKLKHDFGDVSSESSSSTEFIVTNTGDKPLIIEKVSASCGCTTPKKPEKPIAPGASDIIEVTFKPKPGQKNEIKKTVTVKANTMEKVHTLEIRAFVTP